MAGGSWIRRGTTVTDEEINAAALGNFGLCYVFEKIGFKTAIFTVLSLTMCIYCVGMIICTLYVILHTNRVAKGRKMTGTFPETFHGSQHQRWLAWNVSTPRIVYEAFFCWIRCVENNECNAQMYRWLAEEIEWSSECFTTDGYRQAQRD